MSFAFVLTTILLVLNIQSLDLSNWMKIKSPSISNKTLKEMTIFGTHDSGAYNLSKIQMPGDENEWLEIMIYAGEAIGLPLDVIINLWGDAHPKYGNFYNQLSNGVRYFDLRCGWLSSKQDWFAYHWTVGQTIKYLCKEIENFLSSHTSEIVLIEATHLKGTKVNDEKVQLLINIFEGAFGNLLYPRSKTFPTYNEMIKSGHRILLSLAIGSSINSSIISNTSDIWNSVAFQNSYANTANVNDMIAYNDKQVMLFNDNGTKSYSLFKISWTLTPQTSTVIDMVLPSHPHSLLELAEIANKQMWKWVETQVNGNMSIGNVFVYDNYPTVNISQIINAIYA